ncbi:unnamed protein product [Calypogeia fissa]
MPSPENRRGHARIPTYILMTKTKDLFPKLQHSEKKTTEIGAKSYVNSYMADIGAGQVLSISSNCHGPVPSIPVFHSLASLAIGLDRWVALPRRSEHVMFCSVCSFGNISWIKHSRSSNRLFSSTFLVLWEGLLAGCAYSLRRKAAVILDLGSHYGSCTVGVELLDTPPVEPYHVVNRISNLVQTGDTDGEQEGSREDIFNSEEDDGALRVMLHLWIS